MDESDCTAWDGEFGGFKENVNPSMKMHEEGCGMEAELNKVRFRSCDRYKSSEGGKGKKNK